MIMKSLNHLWNSINTIYLWNSINDLCNSINDLCNSINDLWNSINDLSNSKNDLLNSINVYFRALRLAIGFHPDPYLVLYNNPIPVKKYTTFLGI